MSKDLTYTIIGSSSKGNCVVIEDMVFDIGLSYKKIKEHLYDANYLFITHKHSDHLNKTTYNRIRKDFPRIKIVSNYEVASIIPVDEVVGDTTVLKFKDRTVTSFKAPHDVVCVGYVVDLHEKDNLTFMYSTDIAKTDYIPDIKYDYMFLESNHCDIKLKEIMGKGMNQYKYDVFANAKRHLSTQECKAFYYTHRRTKDSPLIELHKSERFY